MMQASASQLPRQVIGVNYNGTYYYYLRNAQGDVVKLIDKTGSTVVEYTYDSWGKLLSTSGSLAETFGAEQPFRYRGYVYDEETGLYYLQSRYYNPELGRFISADIYLSNGQGVLGHNAYAYCLNNPVNLSDNEGKFGLFTAIGAIVGGIVGGAFSAITGGSFVEGLVSGAVSGAIAGASVNLVVCTGGVAAVPIIIAGGIASGVAGEFVDSSFASEDEKSTIGDYIVAGATGALMNLMTFGMGGGSVGAKNTVKEASKYVAKVIARGISKKMAKQAINYTVENLATEMLTNGLSSFCRRYIRHFKEYLLCQ